MTFIYGALWPSSGRKRAWHFIWRKTELSFTWLKLCYNLLFLFLLQPVRRQSLTPPSPNIHSWEEYVSADNEKYVSTPVFCGVCAHIPCYAIPQRGKILAYIPELHTDPGIWWVVCISSGLLISGGSWSAKRARKTLKPQSPWVKTSLWASNREFFLQRDAVLCSLSHL